MDKNKLNKTPLGYYILKDVRFSESNATLKVVYNCHNECDYIEYFDTQEGTLSLHFSNKGNEFNE